MIGDAKYIRSVDGHVGATSSWIAYRANTPPQDDDEQEEAKKGVLVQEQNGDEKK